MKKVYTLIFVIIVLVLGFIYYKKSEAKVLFVGDMMFDRQIRQVGYAKGGDYVFSCINNFLKDSDLVVGNLEGPITENPSRSLLSEVGGPDNYTFTFPTDTAKLLAENNIKLVNLGNNHISNFGGAGIISTRKFLDGAGVNYFGGMAGNLPNGDVGEPIYRTELGGNKISFISYNEFGGDSPDKVAQKIKDEKSKGQTVIIFAHWGDEYSVVPERVKEKATLFSKSGASLIIGSHPHVMLPSDKIGDTRVYYSLGNFIFDQYWNSDVSTGLTLEVQIKGKPADWKIIEHKVSLNRDGRTCLTD